MKFNRGKVTNDLLGALTEFRYAGFGGFQAGVAELTAWCDEHLGRQNHAWILRHRTDGTFVIIPDSALAFHFTLRWC